MKKVLYLVLCLASSLHSSGLMVASSFAEKISKPKALVANAYKVKPDDASPKQSYNDIRNMMEKLATRGYTDFGPWGDGYINTKRKEQGSYSSNGSYSGGRASQSIKKENVRFLTESVYKINQKNLVKAIQNGALFKSGSIFENRLLLQEFFLGQLAVTVPPIMNAKFFSSSDKSALQGILADIQSVLKQARYIRNGLNRSKQVDSAVGKIGISKAFSPIDFVVGAIIVNESSGGIKNSGSTYIKPGHVGFLSIKSSSLMNNWTNVGSNAAGLPMREPMVLGQLNTNESGKKTSGKIAFSPSADLETIIIEFAGQTYLAPKSPEAKQYVGKPNVKYFVKGQMQKFFKELGPWAVVIIVPENETPFISHLVKMNMIDFGKNLKFDGSLMGVSGNPTFADVIQSIQNIYTDSVVMSSSTGNREVSNNYIFGNYWAQGMLNGLLEVSEFQHLADSNNDSFLQTESVTMNSRRPAPGPYQILAYNSGVDSLFLRAFRITKAALSLSDITQNLLNRYVDGKSQLLQVLKNPAKSIFVGNNPLYIGAKRSYLPVIKVVNSKIVKPKVVTKSPAKAMIKAPAKSVTKSPAKAMIKTSAKSVARSSSKVMIKAPVKSVTRSLAKRPEMFDTFRSFNQSSTRKINTLGTVVGHQSTSQVANYDEDSASIEAYKKGYKQGQEAAMNENSFDDENYENV